PYIFDAAMGLLYSGKLCAAIAAFKKAHTGALRIGSANGQLAAAMVLSHLYFELGLEKEQRFWEAKFAPLLHVAPTLAGDFDFVIGRVLVALHSGRIEDAESAMREAETFGLFSSPIRARWKRALELGIRLLKRPATDSDEAMARSIVAERLNTMNGV